jgi:hypothetical protein
MERIKLTFPLDTPPLIRLSADDEEDDEEDEDEEEEEEGEYSMQPPPRPDLSPEQLLQYYHIPKEFMPTLLPEQQIQLLHRLLLAWRKYYRSALSHAYI